MAFLTERLFQILESHRIYDSIGGKKAMAHFMERHVICVWSYHALLNSLAKELVGKSQPLNPDNIKESLRLISEILLDEEASEYADGQYFSQLELYLEAMQDVGCDITPTLNFFELIERGIEPEKAIYQVEYPPEVIEYGLGICKILREPLHKRATAFFYEGEPYIPDRFLSGIDSLSSVVEIDRVLDYFENHIEGLKQLGYSCAGRLVELICNSNFQNNLEAEKTAETILRQRIQFWEILLQGLDYLSVDQVMIQPARHLRLV